MPNKEKTLCRPSCRKLSLWLQPNLRRKPCIVVLRFLKLSPSSAGRSIATGQCALASVARACKMFCDPALDELWKEQDTLYNIVQCMPQDVWEEPDEDGGMTLARPVVPTDWDRALIYARRVKTFSFDDQIRERGYPTTAEFLETLGMCVPGPQLFPNLEILGWSRCSKCARSGVFPNLIVQSCGHGLGRSISEQP
ncbi:hypothetical protein C8R47DRAFT_960735 [Mycena vitilis]|nr:hypothetical protein C8R47DRAFT_960735 [Mycena vitilis]